MEDNSLMNPEYLEARIEDWEDDLESDEHFAARLHDDVETIRSYIEEAFKEKESVTLSYDQANEIAVIISEIDRYRDRCARTDKAVIRYFKQLQTDRRWIIGSKLKFLRKK